MNFELEIAIRTSLLLICAAVFVVALRKSTAAARHAVWSGAMLGAMVLPLVSLLIPALQLPLIQENPAFNAGIASVRTEKSTLTISNTHFSYSRIPTVSETPEGSTEPSSPPSPANFRRWALWLWFAGFLFQLFRLVNSTLSVRRMARNSAIVEDEAWQTLRAELESKLSIRKAVDLRLGGEMPPMTWGLRRHTILLPNAARHWRPERRRAVLAHELAHVKRCDGLSHLASQLVCGIYWFNPLIWFAAHQQQFERERACDDRVLLLGTPADAYARHLLEIAGAVRGGSPMAAMSMSHPSQLETRLLAILDSSTRRMFSRFKLATTLFLLTAITLSIATIQITSVAALALPAFRIPVVQPVAQSQTVLPAPVNPTATVGTPSSTVVSTPSSIEGTVTDLSTGGPIDGAIVVLCDRRGIPCVVPGQGGGRGLNSPPRTEFSAITDKDGKFKIGGLAAGVYTAVAAHDGFSATDTNPDPTKRGAIVTVVAGIRTPEVHLELAGTTSISGRIIDSGGNPMAALRVRILRLTYDRNGAANLTALGGTLGTIQTDDRGEYRIFGVMPGTYYIGAVPQMMDATVVASYYPGVVSLEQATPIMVQSGGETTGINFTLAPWKQYSVRFKTAGALPPAGVTSSYQLRPRGAVLQPPVLRASSLLPDATGEYILRGVPPGSFDFIIASLGQTAATRPAPQHFEFDVFNKDVDLGTLVFKPGVAITGRLTLKNGTLPQSANVNLMSVGPGLGSTANVRVAGDGSFTLPQIADGRYLVSSPSAESQGFFVSAAHYGGRDVLNEGLIADGIDHGLLELVLDNPAGAVEGQLLNNIVPIANAQVVLIPAAERRWNAHLFLDTATDQTGKFSIANVAPGEYNVLAWERSVGDAYKNAEFLKDHLARAVRITVTKGARSLVIGLRPAK